jgi:hypothetical protein
MLEAVVKRDCIEVIGWHHGIFCVCMDGLNAAIRTYTRCSLIWFDTGCFPSIKVEGIEEIARATTHVERFAMFNVHQEARRSCVNWDGPHYLRQIAHRPAGREAVTRCKHCLDHQGPNSTT